ncbi:hypothetical protein MTO96_045095 [Rhipicephalus appendiculatus]
MIRLAVKMMNLDPLQLPDFSVEVPMLGGIELQNGSITGLSTIRRTGTNCITDDQKGLHVEIDLGLGDLTINLTTAISIGMISEDVNILVVVNCTRLAMEITETSEAKLSLKSFEIKTMQGLDVHLKALKLTDAAVNALLDTLTTLFKGLIADVAEQLISGVIELIIEMINDTL